MSKNQPNSITSHRSTSVRLIAVDPLIRLNQVEDGVYLPMELPELADYLASSKGKIRYQISGNSLIDQLGRQKRRLKCIISGWFEVADAVTLLPVRFELNLTSSLVLVLTEEDLPPLEDESEDEDYIVCGADFDVLGRVQEEILLALPTNTPMSMIKNNTSVTRQKSESLGLPKSYKKTIRVAGDAFVDEGNEKRLSPFASLASLKKLG
jgi:uncharacterized protein